MVEYVLLFKKGLVNNSSLRTHVLTYFMGCKQYRIDKLKMLTALDYKPEILLVRADKNFFCMRKEGKGI